MHLSICKPVACLLFGSLLFLLMAGFRPFAQSTEQVVAGSEAAFDVRSHAELYIMVRVEKDGTVTTNRWLLMYEYEPNGTRGLWRILPEENTPSTTLLSIQQTGQPTELFLKEGEHPARKVEDLDRQMAFGMTDWNLEDIYDDDKHAWRHQQIGNSVVRGVEAIVIESRYSDPILRDDSYFDKRRSYLARSDNRFLRSDYFGRGSNLIKSIQADHHEDVGGSKERRIRAKRLEILDYRDGSITIMVRVGSVFDTELPTTWFTPQGLDNWNEETDREVLAMIN